MVFIVIAMKHVFEILDEAKEMRNKIREAFQAGDLNPQLLASWIDKSLELDEAEAKKLDELFERLVRLEDEIRGGKGPQAVPQ